jgi:hypothetical protein
MYEEFLVENSVYTKLRCACMESTCRELHRK